MSQTDRTHINRANAQKSTGPRTEQGKQRSCMNAFKHNLSGQHLVLVEHEYDAYSAACERGLRDLKPMAEPERQIAQKIIDINFRLNRITAVETNMYNLDTMSLVAPYLDDSDAAESANRSDDRVDIGDRAQIDDRVQIDARVEIMAAQTRAWKTDAHTFDLLGRYEARLSKQLLAYHKELEHLQTVRKAEEAIEKEAAEKRQHEQTRAASASAGFLFALDNTSASAQAPVEVPAVSAEPEQNAAVTPQLASFGNSVPPASEPAGPAVLVIRQPVPPPARLLIPGTAERPAA